MPTPTKWKETNNVKIQNNPGPRPRQDLFNNPKYQEFREKLDVAAGSSGGAALGYGVGVASGATLHGLGASTAYTYLGPAMGTLIGALKGNAAVTGNKKVELAADAMIQGSWSGVIGDGVGDLLRAGLGSNAYAQLGGITTGLAGALIYLASNDRSHSDAWAKGATTLSLTGIGTPVLDAVGQGLTHLTGNPAYAAMGPVAGAANGLLTGLFLSSEDDEASFQISKKALPLTLGLTAGTTAGALAGALLTSVTGAPIYQSISPWLGAFAGTATGAALAFGEK